MAEPSDGTSPQFAQETDGLSYRAGDRHPLVEGIRFSVRKGDIVAIAGPNGAGKSTLLRMLAGLLAPSAGTVRLFGRAIDRYSAADRARRIAVVGQRDEPDPRLSVADYAALGRIPHGVTATKDMHQQAIAESLASVGLTGKEEARLGLCCPAANFSARQSPGRLPRNRMSFFWTNPPTTSIRPPKGRSFRK